MKIVYYILYFEKLRPVGAIYFELLKKLLKRRECTYNFVDNCIMTSFRTLKVPVSSLFMIQTHVIIPAPDYMSRWQSCNFPPNATHVMVYPGRQSKVALNSSVNKTKRIFSLMFARAQRRFSLGRSRSCSTWRTVSSRFWYTVCHYFDKLFFSLCALVNYFSCLFVQLLVLTVKMNQIQFNWLH